MRKIRLPSVTVALLFLSLSLGAACRKSPETPEEVVRQFFRLARSGSAKKAWSLLSHPTQSEIRELHPEDDERSPGARLFHDLGFVVLAPPAEVRTLEVHDDFARVEAIPKTGRSAILSLRLESGAWRIDLLDALQVPTATTSTTTAAAPEDAPEDAPEAP